MQNFTWHVMVQSQWVRIDLLNVNEPRQTTNIHKPSNPWITQICVSNQVNHNNQ